MNLIDNQVFTIYRDSEFEAFYDVDLKNRWKIILAHIVIHFFPVLIAIIVTQTYSLGIFGIWIIFFSLFLYAIVILETVAYLFPKLREIYKKYFFWILFPSGVLIGIGGYFAGSNLIEYVGEQEMDFGNIALLIGAGSAGVFFLFILSQFGLSQILYASKSLYSRKAKVEADIQFATEIQERILKEVSVSHNGSAAYACSYPANELGGDYFELSIHDDQLFASIGDISGHSFGAGLLMTMTKSALQTHLEYNREPAEVMSSLNTMLNQQTDRSMYATMTLVKLDLTDNKATLCNAGHLPVFHIPAGSDRDKVIYRHKKGLGLGITKTAVYDNLEFEVQEGDLLILYSDGLIETRDQNMQIRDAEFFERLLTKSLETGITSPRELAIEILEKVRESDYSKQMEDDSTLIVIVI
jgi:serine phosphatase RsbU (regulator of sigma subunit)